MISKISWLVPGGLLLALALSTHPAHADDNQTGLEVSLRPAYGSAGSSSPVVYAPGLARLATAPDGVYGDTASPYGGGFVGEAAIGFRPIRWVSFGLAGSLRSSSASDVPGITNLSRSAQSAGPYVRGYLPLPYHFEPYIGLGLEYMHDAQTYNESVSGVNADFRLVHYGIAVPISVGVDYRFLDYFAVGPSFQYTQVVAANACAGASAPGFASTNYCSGDSNAITAGKSYGVWSLGLDLRVTLF